MHYKKAQALIAWVKAANSLGFKDDTEMLTFLYWEKGLTPKCIGSLLDKTPQVVSWRMKVIGIPRGQFRKCVGSHNIPSDMPVSFLNYSPVNPAIKITGSPCKNCHHQQVSKVLCDCQEIKRFQQADMGQYHFMQESSPVVYETAY